MKCTIVASFVLLATATLCAQELTLHVTSYKYEYVGDKPTTQTCKDYPCTTGIYTVEGWAKNSNANLITAFLIQCKSWVLLGNPTSWGKCWVLKVGQDYAAAQDGGDLLFFGEKRGGTDPVYHILEATERPK
jgi:hypothetical protein